MLHYDLKQVCPALATRDAAESLGRQAENGDIIGWSFETAAWFAIYDGSAKDIVESAEQGFRHSPEDSAAAVMNVLKLGVGQARLGRPLEAERAIAVAEETARRMAKPQYPDHHFAFDAPSKLSMYISRIYAMLGRPVEAERHARQVIEMAASEHSGYSVPPTRECFGRLDLASALLDRDELAGC